jgi:hypothetical protein
VIPRGRPVVDAAAAAELLGVGVKTFRNRIAPAAESPEPVNPGRRKLLYDVAQMEAYRDGRPIPELPAGAAPGDLLDEHDAAELLGVEYATVRKDRNLGRLPEHVEVCGLAHWPRRVLERVPDERPGRGVGGGRPRKSA